MERLFKEGDKVKVREDIAELDCKYNMVSEMTLRAGETVTVRAIDGDKIRLEEDKDEKFGCGWSWTENLFETLDASDNCDFKVGDIIESKPGNPGSYIITVPGVKLRVVSLDSYGEGYIKVELIEGKHKGREFNVEHDNFQLVENELKVGDHVKYIGAYDMFKGVGVILNIDSPYSVDVRAKDGDCTCILASLELTDAPSPIDELKAEIADKQRELAKMMREDSRGDTEDQEEYEFKIGDTVEVTNASGSNLSNGDIGEIIELDGNLYRVTVDGELNLGNWQRKEDIVKVSSKSFKVGDRVIFVDSEEQGDGIGLHYAREEFDSTKIMTIDSINYRGDIHFEEETEYAYFNANQFKKASHAFKVGDKVKILDESWSEYGAIKEVTSISPNEIELDDHHAITIFEAIELVEEADDEEDKVFRVTYDDDENAFDLSIDDDLWALRVEKEDVEEFFKNPDQDRVTVVSLDGSCLPVGFEFETDEDSVYIVRER